MFHQEYFAQIYWNKYFKLLELNAVLSFNKIFSDSKFAITNDKTKIYAHLKGSINYENSKQLNTTKQNFFSKIIFEG